MLEGLVVAKILTKPTVKCDEILRTRTACIELNNAFSFWTGTRMLYRRIDRAMCKLRSTKAGARAMLIEFSYIG